MFIIIDRATGQRMPQAKCFTRAEPSATKAPRLFAKQAHAEAALSRWREGVWYNDIDQYGDGEGPRPRHTASNTAIAVARQARDMAVVPVRIEVLA